MEYTNVMGERKGPLKRKTSPVPFDIVKGMSDAPTSGHRCVMVLPNFVATAIMVRQ